MADDTTTDTTTATVPPVQATLRRYLAARSAHERARHQHWQLEQQSEKTSDYRATDDCHDEVLVPAARDALDAADALFDALAGLASDMQAALSDAWAYRIGEASGENDENLDPQDRERARNIQALADQLGLSITD